MRFRASISLLVACLVLLTPGCDVLRSQLQSPSARYEAEGDRLAASDRKAEALLAYRQSVEQDSLNVSALHKLARAYAGQGRKRMARRYLQKALTLQPGQAELSSEIASLAASESMSA